MWYYNGDTVGEVYHGHGTLSDGLVTYEGVFEKGELKWGTIQSPQGWYQGGISDFQMDGQGEFKGDVIYYGSFSDGTFHGPGELLDNGCLYKGHFEHNKKVGIHQVTHPNGQQYQWENHKVVLDTATIFSHHTDPLFQCHYGNIMSLYNKFKSGQYLRTTDLSWPVPLVHWHGYMMPHHFVEALIQMAIRHYPRGKQRYTQAMALHLYLTNSLQ